MDRVDLEMENNVNEDFDENMEKLSQSVGNLCGDLDNDLKDRLSNSDRVVTDVPDLKRTPNKQILQPKKRQSKVRRKRRIRYNKPYNNGRRKQLRRGIVHGIQGPDPLTPYNTTQFLMSDYNYNNFSPEVRLEDYSAESEVDFLLKEFSKDYDYEKENSEVNNKQMEERGNWLGTLCRQDLLAHYLSLDCHVRMLERRLMEVKDGEETKARKGEVEYDWRKGEAHMEPETAEKIRVFQEEIARLETENRDLIDEEMDISCNVGE